MAVGCSDYDYDSGVQTDLNNHSINLTNRRNISEEEIRCLIAARYKLPAKVVEGVLSAYNEIILNELCSGNSIKTKLGLYSISIKNRIGKIPKPQQARSSGSHQEFRFNIELKRENIALIRQKLGLKMEKNYKVPEITFLTNISAKGYHRGNEASDVIQADGNNLCFNESNRDEGVFICSTDGNELVRCVVSVNQPEKLIFQLPFSITAGEYRLLFVCRAENAEQETATSTAVKIIVE